MYRALQLSIARDKVRTISFMIFIVSDKQRWNFIKKEKKREKKTGEKKKKMEKNMKT